MRVRKVVSTFIVCVLSLFLIVACGGGGGGGSSSTSGNVQIASISVSPSGISTMLAYGNKATLSWNVTYGNSVEIFDGTNSTLVNKSGSMEVSPTATTTYELYVDNTKIDQVTLHVYDPDTVVKQLNVAAYSDIYDPYAWDGFIRRWPDGTVYVYDYTNYSRMQEVLDTWNAVLPSNVQLQLTNDINQADVTYQYASGLTDPATGRTACGLQRFTSIINDSNGNNTVYDKSEIEINSDNNISCWYFSTYIHELGHALGMVIHPTQATDYYGNQVYSSEEAGVMDPIILSTEITPLLQIFMKRLYDLPVGYCISGQCP